MIILLHMAAAACYAAAFWRGAFFWAAAALHAASLAAQFGGAPRFDFGIALSAFMLLAGVIGRAQTRRPLPQNALAVLAAVCSFAPLFFQTAKPPPPLLALAHILPAMLAYSFAVLAALQSADLWRAEKARRRLAASSSPPLLVLEADCFRSVARAFILLSLALVSGFWAGDAPLHKTLFAALTWLAFGGLLCGRHFWGWRGRTALGWLAAGMLFFVLSYFGTHFVLQVLLNRAA